MTSHTVEPQDNVVAAKWRWIGLACRDGASVNGTSMRTIWVDRRCFGEGHGQTLSDVLKHLVRLAVEQVAHHGSRSGERGVSAREILLTHIGEVIRQRLGRRQDFCLGRLHHPWITPQDESEIIRRRLGWRREHSFALVGAMLHIVWSLPRHDIVNRSLQQLRDTSLEVPLVE